MKKLAVIVVVTVLLASWLVPVCSASGESVFEGKILFSDSPEIQILRVESYSGMSSAPTVELAVFGDGSVRVTHRKHTRLAPTARIETMHLPTAEVQTLLEQIALAGVLDLSTVELRRLQEKAASQRRPRQFIASDLGGYMLTVNLAWYQQSLAATGESNLEHTLFVRAPQYFAETYPSSEQFGALSECFKRLEGVLTDGRLEVEQDSISLKEQ